MKTKGFTLIELVVVMAIIAALVALAAFNFNQARARARDVSRKSDLRQFVNALEAYKADKQSYPSDLPTLVTAGYLSEVFIDPKNKQTVGSWTEYVYTRNATDYLKFTITACLENRSDPDSTGVACGPSNLGMTYQTTNP